MDTHTQGIRWSRRRRIATLAVAGGRAVLLGVVLVLQFSVPKPPATPGATARDAASGGKPSEAERLAHQTPSSPSVKLPESNHNVDPGTARGVAIEYNKGKFNAFFDGKVFLANAMASGKLSVKALKDQLLSTQELQALPPDVRVLTD